MIRPALKRCSKPMRQSRSTGKPRMSQVRRWESMRALGCIACIKNKPPMWRVPMEVEIHHLLRGGRRMGHDFTVALCHWHHQAKRFPSTTSGYTAQAVHYGPSLEREPRRFHEIYGTDDELLTMQNSLLKSTGEY